MIPFLGFGVYIFHGWKKWLSATSLILVLLLIILLQTRAVWIGIIVAGIFSALFFGFSSQSFGLAKSLKKYVAIGVVIFAFFFTVALVVGKGNVYVERLKSIVNPKSSDNIYRLKIWEKSMEMVADYPVTGVGAGNWQFKIVDYFKGLGLAKEQLNWVRPHNDFIWVVTEKGIIGLFFFLALFGAVFWYFIQIIRQSEDKRDKMFALFLFFGLISYLIVSFFDFPYERINQQVYLALMMASMVALRFRSKPEKPVSKMFFTPIFIAVLLLVSFSAVYSYHAYQLEIHLRQARIALQQKNWKVMLNEAQLAKTPFKSLDAEAVPVDWYIGLAYFSLDDNKKAIFCYEKAKLANPTMITVLKNLGQAYFKNKDYKNAEINYLAALDILPTYREALFNISTVYYYLSDYQKVLDALTRIDDKNDQEIQKRIEQLKKMI